MHISQLALRAVLPGLISAWRYPRLVGVSIANCFQSALANFRPRPIVSPDARAIDKFLELPTQPGQVAGTGPTFSSQAMGNCNV